MNKLDRLINAFGNGKLLSNGYWSFEYNGETYFISDYVYSNVVGNTDNTLWFKNAVLRISIKNPMLIAVYNNDADRHPYLVHELKEDTVILGLRSFPDTEQDNETNLSEIELLSFVTLEYKEAKEIINQFLN